MNSDKSATHLFRGTVYKEGSNVYALYFQKGWRESASITNEKLLAEGKEINVARIPSEDDTN